MNDFLVSHNVQMSENAKISWSQVSDKPYIPQTASDIGALPNNSPRLTHIDANGIYTGTISANQITTGTLDASKISVINLSASSITSGTINANHIRGGTLSGVTINIDTDAKVGNNLYLGSYSDYGTVKRIYFNDRANISGGHGFAGADIRINVDTLWLSATEVVFGDSVGNRATVDFTGCEVKGLNAVAKFG